MMNYKDSNCLERRFDSPRKVRAPMQDSLMSLNIPCPASPASSTLSLTPGRVRNIDQDMEALRLSRQDNPFLQQIIASRESLDCLDDSESDHTNLMSQDYSDLDIDPMTLPEIHEHMIRSPPPVSWPRSPNFKAFQFPNAEETARPNSTPCKESSISSQQEDLNLISSSLRSRHFHDKFSILSPVPKRSLSEVRRSQYSEDSVQLMSEDE